MDDLTTLPAAVAQLSVADRLRTRLTDYGIAWADEKLLPTSSNIPESLAGLERELDDACRPAPDTEITGWLTLLWVATKKQATLSEFRSENVFAVYAANLRKYPADIVGDVLSNWTSTPKPNNAHHWWPSLGEIEDAIRGPSETRRMIRNAVKEWDMDKGRHQRLAQLYNDLAMLEGQGFTFNIRHLLHAPRKAQIAGIRDEADRVRAEIYKLEGPNPRLRAAGDN